MSYEKLQLPVDDGLREAFRIVNQQYLAKASGINRSILSFAINHNLYNGKPYELPADKIGAVNQAIQQCAKELKQVRFSTESLSEEECPYSYGDTPADQMRVFRERFKTKYILIDSMGWTEGKIKMCFNNKAHRYINKVSQDDLVLINRMVQLAAQDLESIMLVDDLLPTPSLQEGELSDGR